MRMPRHERPSASIGSVRSPLRSSPVRVFLTGGTGMIGSHVAERLRSRGDAVTALVRPTSDARHLRDLGCDLVEGDVADPPRDLAAAMRGADAVIHAAAKVFQAGFRDDYLRANVQGTENVLAAAALAAPRVIHVSSVAVYAGVDGSRPLTEDRWIEADPDRQNSYAASKHLSERAAWRLHQDGRIRLTTVRPSVVYGERDRSATRVFVRVASFPLVPLPGGGRTTLPVVYADNVARGIIAALDREGAVGRAYNLARDTPITGRELLSFVARELDRRSRVVPLPGAPARLAAAALERLTRWLPRVPTLDVERAVRSLTRDNPYDSTRARLELGWGPLVTHHEGMRRTMEWWRTGRGPRGTLTPDPD